MQPAVSLHRNTGVYTSRSLIHPLWHHTGSSPSVFSSLWRRLHRHHLGGGGVLVQLCSSRIYSRVISSWLSGLSAWQRWWWGAWVGNWNCVISCFISACLALEEIHPFSYKKSAHNPAGLGFLKVKTGFSGVICSLHPALESRRSSTASERKGARGLRASLTRGKSLTRSRSKSPFRSFRFRKSKPDADTTYSDEEGGETFRLIGRSAGGGAGRWQEKPFPPFSKCHNLATFFLT